LLVTAAQRRRRMKSSADRERDMERSREVEDALARFYEVFGRATAEDFDRVVAHQPDAMVIGSEPWLWLRDRETWKRTFLSLGDVALEPGGIRGFRHGRAGWLVDEPTFVAADGRRLRLRLTGVAVEEDDGWKLVQLHISVGVPDEVALVEAPGWEAAAPA
jgi:hypothetical protein